LRFDAPAPEVFVRATVCERMGWTFEYFDERDVHEISELLAVWDGIERAQKRG